MVHQASVYNVLEPEIVCNRESKRGRQKKDCLEAAI